MDDTFTNPFSVTRAADFTDEQIDEYWVDFANDNGFLAFVKPRLEMPMLVLGGKGSGKTHVMRYLSFPLQRIRNAKALISGIMNEGYLGIYMRCSGLNSNRFFGKGQTEEVWADLFAYYMELWLAQMTLDVCCEVLAHESLDVASESEIVNEIRGLFDDPISKFPNTLSGVNQHLRDLQRELDVAINNCAIDGVLNIAIRTTSGRLIFGIPRVLSANVHELNKVLFVYLIDEFENLTTPQQKLVNTLIREKEPPCTFKVGSKLYGVRTMSTYCADEENKEGSEYEKLPLDDRLRKNEKQYETFAARLVVRRLASRGLISNVPTSDADRARFLSAAFDRVSYEGLAEQATSFVSLKYEERKRPYFRNLEQVLKEGMTSSAAPGVTAIDDVYLVLEKLACPDYPLLEKLNCFSLYQRWSSSRNLLEAANAIGVECSTYLRDRDTSSAYHDKLLHWKYDLLAQLRRECDQKQVYAGFETIVELSWGNPRHLLILLKHIVSWAGFKGERPFGESPISVKAQSDGVKEAAEWFFRDARMTGKDGQLLQDAIGRLGTLLRGIRYSHKPSECSLSTFSFDPASVSDETRRLIDLAEKWLLLVPVGDQRDRNSERVDKKLQINRMLSPRWDISYSRRGALSIAGKELNAMFDPSFSEHFEKLLASRIDRMTAPFFGTKSSKRESPQDNQQTLPGLGDD